MQQPLSKGKGKGNWDYFYYVFATENGERFEINVLIQPLVLKRRVRKNFFLGRAIIYQISWKATEPDKRKFGKEDFIEIEKWNVNTDDKPQSNKNIGEIFEKEWENEKNKTQKELSISIIREFFREWNVKSIEITSSGDLFCEYNNGNSEVIKNDEKGTGIIKNSLDKVLNKRKLNQQELEKLQTGSPHQPTSPKSGYTPYLIGGGIVVIVLGGILISYRLIRKKK